MESHATSLVLTKLRMPSVRVNALPRALLLKRLAPDIGTDLVLVCAPAGYGKTTLLAAWARQLRQSGARVAWYSLDEGDNRPLAFAAYLLAALQQALGPGSGLEAVEQQLRASVEIDLLQLMPDMINAMLTSSQPVLLVLDDYHLLRTPAGHQAMEYLITHRPENLVVAIGSRTNPPLPLARLRGGGRLIELHAADLRFSDEETGQFLRGCMKIDAEAGIAHRLTEQVEGWAAGVQLAALSLAGSDNPQETIASFSWGRRDLAEYLLAEVMDRLPEETQYFLLYTSILERLSAAACDGILNIHTSANQLRQIEQANLFLTALDDAGEWYRYHALFREFLQAWLNRTQPERAAALHRAACDWFAEHGMLSEAAQHAFRCGDWLFAADFVERHSFTLIIQSEIATIYEWCSAFPEAVLRSRARLCVFQALALAYRFQAKYHARIDTRLQQAEQAMLELKDPEQAFETAELAGTVRAFQAMTPDPTHDAHDLLGMAERRLAAFPPDSPGQFPWLLISGYAHLALSDAAQAAAVFEAALPLALDAGLFFGVIETAFHLARLAYAQGNLAQSLTICRDWQEQLEAVLLQTGLALPALGCLEMAAGCVLLEQDQPEEAESCLRRGLERMGLGMHPYYLMTAHQALFRLYEIQGKREQAYACLDRLDMLWPDIQFFTQGLRVESRLRAHVDEAGAAQAAGAWLQSYQQLVGEVLLLPGIGPVGAAEVFYQANLTWARLQIVLGAPDVVQAYLERQLPAAQAAGLQGRAIELTLIEAQMLYRQGKLAEALSALERAITHGGPLGYRRIFDQTAVLDELLFLAGQSGVCPAYLPPILAAIRAARSRQSGSNVQVLAGAISSDLLPGEALTARELDVLRMMAEGASNQVIAGRLVISVGTVKIHINHIFSKLAVGNRTEAVAKARRLGLIH